MELYLRSENQSVEFQENMEKVELVTELEFGGSSQFKDIHILVSKPNRFICVLIENFLLSSAWSVNILIKAMDLSSSGSALVWILI